MFSRHVLVCATLVFCITAAADAEDSKSLNVQTLYQHCTQPVGTWAGGFCLGFVAGVGQQMIWSGFIFKDAQSHGGASAVLAQSSSCPKAFVSNGAMVQAFVNWGQKHPEKWSMDAQMGAMEAVREVWPCSP
jgi:Rap1a immunity proteins